MLSVTTLKPTFTTGCDLRGNALSGAPLKLWFDDPPCLICAYARAPAIAPTSTHAQTSALAAPAQVLFACPHRGSSLAGGSLQLDVAATAVAAEAHDSALWVGFAKEERTAVEAALEGADGLGLPRALERGREAGGIRGRQAGREGGRERKGVREQERERQRQR